MSNLRILKPLPAPKWQIWLWLTLLAVPVLTLLALMFKYGVKFPFWDQWELVPYLHKLKDGNLSLGDLWQQHNEHRIFLPRSAMVVIAALTHWSNLAEMVASLAVALGSFALLCLMLRRSVTWIKFWHFGVATIAMAWLFFSTGQWENWLWGWQIQWFMSVFGVVLAMCAMTAWPKLWSQRLWLPIAILGAVIANYSLGNGLVAWPAGLAVLLLTPTSWRQRSIWTASGIAAVGLYYYHYSDPNPGSKFLFLKEFGIYVQYVLTYIGSTLSMDGGTNGRIAMGIALLSLFTASTVYLWFARRSALTRVSGWLGLAVYGLVSALLAGVARLDLGVEQAASSRYTTVSALVLMGTVMLSATAVQELYGRYAPARLLLSFASVVLALALTITIGVTYNRGVTHMYELDQNLVGTNHCIHAATDATPDCLLKAYPDKKIVWERISYLRSIHWAGF